MPWRWPWIGRGAGTARRSPTTAARVGDGLSISMGASPEYLTETVRDVVHPGAELVYNEWITEIFTGLPGPDAREVRDRVTDIISTAADYSELGWLLISVALIGLLVPLLTVLLIQRSRFHSRQ